MKSTAPFTVVFSLVLLSACGGGGSETSNPDVPSSYAKELSYQNPDAKGFRFLANPGASSKTHLVLDLIGPSGTRTKGVALIMNADTSKVTWTHPSGGSGTHISLGSVIPLGTSPKLLKEKVTGDTLQVGLFQKSGEAITLGNAPILSLALDLKGATVAKGTVNLAPQSGRQAVILNADGTLSPITIQVGVLSAK